VARKDVYQILPADVKCGAGVSIKDDTVAAIEEAYQGAVSQIGGSASFIYVSMTATHDHEAGLAKIREMARGVPYTGCTTCQGVLIGTRSERTNHKVAGVWVMHDPEGDFECYNFELTDDPLQAAEKGKADATEAAPAKKKKPRIDAYEACRFILIFYIASGHFIATATKNPLILKLVSQINVLVGGFFALSGYLAAYTTTELGVLRPPKCEDRLDNAVKFVVPRVLGFWMLHVFVLLLFSPMFFWVDATYSGPLVALWHGFISVFMLQSWFPLSAEVWNAPTWFLSALSFAFMVLPYALRILAGQKKSELRRTLVILTLLGLIPKIGYSYDLRGAWGIMEGVMSARSHPNYALFNNVRFSPFAALGEVLMGAAACRLVMLDTDEEKATGSALIPLAAMVGLVVARAMGLVSMNDMIVRALVFIPLFLVFLMRLHRTSVGPGGADNPLVKILNNRVLQWLGGISFPIFIVHGPIGQVFYKKAVATKLFGGSLARYGPGMFGVWWIVVIAFSWLLNEFYVKSDTVKKASANLGNAICARLL